MCFPTLSPSQGPWSQINTIHLKEKRYWSHSVWLSNMSIVLEAQFTLRVHKPGQVSAA